MKNEKYFVIANERTMLDGTFTIKEIFNSRIITFKTYPFKEDLEIQKLELVLESGYQTVQSTVLPNPLEVKERDIISMNFKSQINVKVDG